MCFHLGYALTILNLSLYIIILSLCIMIVCFIPDQPSRRRSVSTCTNHRLLAHTKRDAQMQHTYSAAKCIRSIQKVKSSN